MLGATPSRCQRVTAWGVTAGGLIPSEAASERPCRRASSAPCLLEDLDRLSGAPGVTAAARPGCLGGQGGAD